MTKEVYYGKEARDKFLIGVQGIANAVRVTMGGAGKCVLIGNAMYGQDGLFHFQNEVTKDGWKVMKNFESKDAVENRGAMAVREAAENTVKQAGDATTLTGVLAEAIITGGMKLIDEGANSQELKKGIDAAVVDVIKELKNISIPVAGDNEKLFQVATVSANNDTEIGRYIADAFLKIGDDGIVDVDKSNGLDTEVKITNGYKINSGWVSPYFVNNGAKEICEFDNPLILLYDKKIVHHTQIDRALQLSISTLKPLLIICEDSNEEGLAYLTVNNLRKQIRVCVIKAPFGSSQHELMKDIAKVTGATYVSDIMGIDIKKIELSHLGSAKKVTISKDETIIIGGNYSEADTDDTIKSKKDSLAKFVDELKHNLELAKTEEEKYPIEKRIAQLTGSTAIIKVGAATDTELNEKLDRYDDAVRSTKSAIQEGIVAGGGTAFIRVSQKLMSNLPSVTSSDYTNTDFDKGKYLIYGVLSKPLKQIVENTGLDVPFIYNSVFNSNGNFGYNVKSGKVEDLIESGIIDSTKALKCALINASSVAGMALITECSIVTVA